ncbi:MAG TPA: iron ABC transporter substrate-binding protein [Acidimicrobiales bacterium]|nr:iron ABC transporter substrate-binding protein [Acidimicrobiales bacterium]
MSSPRRRIAALLAVAVLSTAAGCGGGGSSSDANALTLYSGRAEVQIKPVIEEFTKETGIKVNVRYGATPELAAQISEEGANSPADLFFAQDAGGLGAVDARGLFAPVPAELLAEVDPRYRADDGDWIGVTGRVRVIVANSRNVPDAEVPTSVFAVTEPRWKGKVGIAPTNGSFEAFVTAMRVQAGEERTRQFLEGLEANDVKTYNDNALILKAVNDGEIDLGLVNHYYWYQLASEIGDDKMVARNHFTLNGDPGALVNVAGVGVLSSTDHREEASQFVSFLLGTTAQTFFAEKNFEFPLSAGVQPLPSLPALSGVQSPNIDLSDLSDLDETLTMLREAGLL